MSAANDNAAKPRHAAAKPDPDAPTVVGRVDKGKVHVGDPITLTITAVARKTLPVNLPNVPKLDPFSVLDRGESTTDLGDGHARHEFKLTVAAYEPGDLQIPEIPVTYLGAGGAVKTVATKPVPVKIASLLANEAEPALKDPTPPVAVTKRDLRPIYIGGGLAAAGVGALVTWLIVRRMRRRVVYRPGPPPRPAHEVALDKLDRLGAYGFLENADNRPFYFAVSEIIREYLGGRFGFDSLELTTDELLGELGRHASRGVVLGEIGGWLSACDLVKFAKVSPTANEARGTLEGAVRIVESTRPRPEPQATVATATASSATAGPGGAGGGAR